MALAATVVAAVASAASLDEAAPFRNFTATLPAESVVLTETSPPVSTTLRVAATRRSERLGLVIELVASWDGFAPGGAGGPTAYPIVRASLAGEERTSLDRAITTAPGTGRLILSAEAPCPAEADACSADFTFTLERVEAAPSGPVSVTWTPLGSASSDELGTSVTLKVMP